jgi:hypothetical protein
MTKTLDKSLIVGGMDELYKIVDHPLCAYSRRVTVELLSLSHDFALFDKRTVDAPNGPCDVLCTEIRPARETERMPYLPHDHIAIFRSHE